MKPRIIIAGVVLMMAVTLIGSAIATRANDDDNIQSLKSNFPPPEPAIITDMFNRVNGLRERRYLEPLKINEALMGAAQDQAEWLVATGIRTHFRPDGSRPSTRAFAAGYVTDKWCCGENYYLSIDATPDLVWNFWTWSRDHYYNLVNPDFVELGVGMSTNGTRISYVLIFGEASKTAAPVEETVDFGLLATPMPDVTVPIAAEEASEPASQTSTSPGERTHIVQEGETLFGIAVNNGTSVQALATANGITDISLIYVGQELVIPGQSTAGTDTTPARSTTLATVNRASAGITAYISQPASGQSITQAVPILGTVRFSPGQVEFYKVEIIGGQFQQWVTIGNTHTGSVQNTQLEVLPGPPALNPGNYRLRLVVIGPDANYAKPPYEIAFDVR